MEYFLFLLFSVKNINYFFFSFQDIIINSKINLSALCKNNYHIKKMIKDEHIMPHLTLKMALSIVSMT